jgi:hypothetical protein
MSNLACIGFAITDQSKFVRLIDAIASDAVEDAPATSQSRHTRWTDASGAAIAVHVGSDRRIHCITPYFVAPGGSAWKVRTHSAADDPGCAHCGGADCDILGSDGQMVTRATVQWLHYQPFREWLTTERSFGLQVVMFGSRVAAYANKEELDAAQETWFPGLSSAQGPAGKSLRVAAESFLPEGMFAPAQAPMNNRASAMLAGQIEACNQLSNTLSGRQFVHLRLRTLPGLVDVVTASVEGTPTLGAICAARGWLVGRPDVTAPEKRSTWAKWLKRT